MAYNVICLLMMYVVPLLIIIVSYGSIYYEIFQKSRMKNSGEICNSAFKHTRFLGIHKSRPFRLNWPNCIIENSWKVFFFIYLDRFRRSSINVLGRAKRRTLRMTITIGKLGFRDCLCVNMAEGKAKVFYYIYPHCHRICMISTSSLAKAFRVFM